MKSRRIRRKICKKLDKRFGKTKWRSYGIWVCHTYFGVEKKIVHWFQIVGER